MHFLPRISDIIKLSELHIITTALSLSVTLMKDISVCYFANIEHYENVKLCTPQYVYCS